MRSSVNFNAGGAVDALGVSWTFDEFYSQFATDGIDKNKNGKFDANELQDLANTYAKNLKDYRYFMFVETDGKLIDTGSPTIVVPRSRCDASTSTRWRNLMRSRSVRFARSVSSA